MPGTWQTRSSPTRSTPPCAAFSSLLRARRLAGVERSGGELIVDSMKAAGIRTVFGVISVHNLPIFDAIAREGGVRVVPARTEHGAAAMADGFARAAGRLE